ncbi:MAG: hypothetical protein AAGG46_01605, partial [Planctomycetota bacterium]
MAFVRSSRLRSPVIGGVDLLTQASDPHHLVVANAAAPGRRYRHNAEGRNHCACTHAAGTDAD